MKGSLLEPVTGRPVTGVVQAWRPDDLPGRDQPLATVQTKADGQFELVLRRWFGEVVLRAHAPVARDDIGRLRAVVQVAELPMTMAIWIDPQAEPLFLRGVPAGATSVRVDDGTRFDVQYGGWLTLPAVPSSRTRLWLDDGTMIADLDPEPRATEQQITFVPAEACAVTGTVLGGGGVGRLRLELLDRAGRWPNPVAVTDLTDPGGGFRLNFTHLLDTLPLPTFGVWAGDERLAVIDHAADWSGTELTGVTIDLREAGTDAVYQLDGQALRRDNRAAAAGLRIELWSGDTLVKTADTDQAGRFTLTFIGPGTPTAAPPLTLRIWESGRRLPDVAVPPDAWVRRRATVFVEVDSAPVAAVRRVSGRVIDPSTRRPVPGLRVEMWDMAARAGGLTGVATFAAEDGTFDVALPVPDAGTPRVFFRLYAGDVLAATLDPPIHWDDTGNGSVLLEVAAAAADGEVLLHELGETIAGAVDRMQQELSRYPSTLGAYVVDELDLSVPVAVQLDQLGQVRAKVVDRAPADEQLGQFRMRVRPVLGARAPLADRLDQPLSVLSELSAAAIDRLNGLRVYSVEDLARLASAPARRGALAGLGLDVDLDRLLDKAILLATTALPMPVREALLRLGVVSTAAFAAYPDPAALAEALSKDLGQTITTEAVQAWQQTVAAATRIVLPES